MHTRANARSATASETIASHASDRTCNPGPRTTSPAPPSGPAWRAALHSLAANVRQAEQRLMLAVLEDALATLLQDTAIDRGSRRLVLMTEQWIASDDDTPFSFASVCEALDLDAGRVRRWVANLRRERLETARRMRVLWLPVARVRPIHATATFGSHARSSSVQP